MGIEENIVLNCTEAKGRVGDLRGCAYTVVLVIVWGEKRKL
jgi:hypothetical protein